MTNAWVRDLFGGLEKEAVKVPSVGDVKSFAKRYVDWDLYECQEEWSEKLLNAKKETLLKAPVGTGKSGLVSFLMPIMKIAEDRNIRIISGTASPILTKRTCRWVSDQLRYNEKLTDEFGPFYHHSNTWEAKEFQVIRDDKNLRDPTYTATTVGKSIEGTRGDLGILDDIIDRRASESEAYRFHSVGWLRDTFMNRLVPGAPLWVIGTVWHPQDAYNVMVEEMGFQEYKYEAIDEDWNPETILCPEIWTVDSLKDRRSKLGEITFNQKFRNNASAVVGQKLNPEFLNYYEHFPTKDPSAFVQRKVMTVDPSGGKTQKSDYFAIAVLAQGRDNNIYALDIWRDRILFNEQVKIVKRYSDAWDPDIIIIESNHDDGALYQEVVRRYKLTAKEHWEKRKKSSRIERINVHGENKTFWIKRDMFDFIHEYINYPGAFDDQLDAVILGIDWLLPFIDDEDELPIIG